MKNLDVTILIISHKSSKLVLDFIESIYFICKIIVIDNSKDIALKKKIKEKYPKVLIKLIENEGYASAINFGRKFIKTNFFLVCNPDIKGLKKKNIKKFLKISKKLNNKFAVLGPRYLNLNKDSIKQSNPNIKIAEWKYISGACMFINKNIFDKINGFDKNFFLYFEETDYCLRAHKFYKNYQLNDIKINHNIGNSVNVKNIKEKKRLEKLLQWHFIWSKYYFYKKNYGNLFSFVYFSPIFIRIIFKIVYYRIINNKDNLNKYITRIHALYTSFIGKKSYVR